MVFDDYEIAMAPDLATRIRRLRITQGKNQTEFGERLGVTQGTVSRWEKGATPEPQHLSALADMAGMELRDFLGVNQPGSVFLNAGQRLMVKGIVAAGVWVHAFELPQEDWTPYTGGAHVKVDPSRRFGLRVEGDSMNMIYPHGTILDCVSTFDTEPPKSGQRVIVTRERSDGDLEATVKEFVVDDDGRNWLVPRSTNPAFQRPIPLDEPDGDVVETRIIALVVGSYRPE